MSRPAPRHRADRRVRVVDPERVSLGRAAVALPLAATLTLSGVAVSSAAWVSAGTGAIIATAAAVAAPTHVAATQQSAGSPTVTVTWQAVANASRYDVYRSGTTAPVGTVTEASYVDTLPTEGTYTYRVVARTGTNWVGPSSAPSGQVAYVVEPGAPTIARSTPDSGTMDDGFTNVAAQTLSGTARPGSSVTIVQNGTALTPPVTATTSGTYSAPVTLAAGANIFTARAADAGGASAPSTPFVVSLDQVAPVTTYDATTKKFEIVENGSGVATTYFKVGSASYAVYEQQQITVPPGSTLLFYSVDKAENREPDKTYTAAAADSTPPKTTRTVSGTQGVNDWYTSSVSLELSATDGGDPASGVERIDYSTDGGQTWTPYSTALSFSSEGARTISYRAVDNRGNTEATQSVEIKIDLTNPTISAQMVSTSKGVDKYTLSAADSLTGPLAIQYRVTAKNKTPGVYATYALGAEIGVNSGDVLEYRVTDSSGRTAAGSVTKQ
ncbi:hypothetical protein KLP28_00340 [Nocardioidaceae bacterium]|nr:hypothetical protein KLP28_00340 [Nocardioidaceae bacterium]